MAELSELELLRDLAVARAARITELEQQQAETVKLLGELQRVTLEVLEGAGASMLERLRLSVPMARLSARLAACIARPHLKPDLVEQLAAASVGVVPVTQTPAEQAAAIEQAYVDRPGVIDFAARRRLRMSATPTEQTKE